MRIYGSWLTGLRQAGFNIGDRQIRLSAKSRAEKNSNYKEGLVRLGPLKRRSKFTVLKEANYLILTTTVLFSLPTLAARITQSETTEAGFNRHAAPLLVENFPFLLFITGISARALRLEIYDLAVPPTVHSQIGVGRGVPSSFSQLELVCE
jgi:hypothetical protein